MRKPTGNPVGRPKKTAQQRADGPYENVFLAMGTVQDRGSFTKTSVMRKLTQQDVERMYEGDGMVRRIVDLPAEEMMRAGFDVDGIDNDEDLRAALDGINFAPTIINALRWARLYGGSLIVMLLNDGGALDKPLNEEAVKEIEQLRVYDRWQATPFQWYEDPGDKRFGKVEIYHISPVRGTPYHVHESRCLIFDGQPVPERIRDENEGWGASIVQQCFDQVTRFNMSQYWASALLERAQQAVHGIPDLGGILSSVGGEKQVKDRMNLVDMARSINNTVVIDAAETYELKSTSFANIQDILDRLGTALCAVTAIPESLLFGKQQKGLGNSGSADIEFWYGKIGQDQETFLLPQIDKVVGLQLRAMGKYVEDYEICFCPLTVPNDKDKAETGYKRAQTLEIYLNAGAIDPSEVRLLLPDEGFPIEDPETLPEPNPEEQQRAELELEGMRLANEQIGKPPPAPALPGKTPPAKPA